jgi:phage-related minor tail protein
MAMDITSLSVQVKSEGVEALAKQLEILVSSAGDVSAALPKMSSGIKDAGDSNDKAAKKIDALLQSMKAQQDLLGANTAYTNAYNAAALGASTAQQQMAASLGASIDAFKALKEAQSEASAMNKAMEASAQSLENMMRSAAIEDKARQYKALKAVQAEAIAMNNALDASLANLEAMMRSAAIENKTRQYRAYGEVQSEAIRLNNQLDVSNKRLEADMRDATIMDRARSFKQLSDAQSEAISINNRLNAAESTRKANGDAFIAQLKDQTARINLHGQALKDYNANLIATRAAELGVSDAAAGMIEGFRKTGVAAVGAHGGMAGIGRELLVLGHEASQGQFSRFGGSLIVLAERINFIPPLLRALSAAALEVGVSMAVALGALALVAVAIGTVGIAIYSMISSMHQFKEFQNILILTGNYAGTTADSMLAMAHSVTESGGSLSHAKTTILELAATGKYTATQINMITESAVQLERAAGVPIENTIKMFDKLSQEVDSSTVKSTHAISKHAGEVNDQYHYMNAATFDRIVALEDEGRAEEALALSLGLLADENKKRVNEITNNLTDAARTLKGWGEAVAGIWDSLVNKQSASSKLIELTKEASRMQEGMAGASGVRAEEYKTRLAKLNEEMLSINKKMLKDTEAATEASEKAILAREQQHNQQRVTAVINAGGTLSAATRALNVFDENVAKTSDEYKLRNATQIAERRIELEKATHEKVAKARSIGLTVINNEIAGIESIYQVELRTANNSIKLIDFKNKAGLLSDREAAAMKEEIILANVELETKALNDELKKIEEFHGKDINEAKQANTKKLEIQKRFGELRANEELRLQEIALQPFVQNAAEEAKAQKASEATLATIQKQTIAVEFQNQAYLKLSATTRAAGVTDKQLADGITQANIDQLQNKMDGLIAEDAFSEFTHQNEIKRIRDEIDERKKLMGGQLIREEQQATNKAILDYNVQWKAANTKIGDDLASAIIEGGGSGFKKLIKDMKLAFAKLILQPILAPISGAFASATTGNGLGGVLGQATGATGVTGGVSGLAGLASSANSAYNAISSGFSGIGTSVTNAVQSAMNFAGVPNAAASAGAFGPTAAGGNIATSGAANAAGTAAGYAAGAVAGKMIGSAISGEFGKSSVVNVATIIGTVLGAGSPLGGIIGGAVGGLLNRAFGMGNKNVSSAGITGTASEVAVTGNTFSNWAQKGGFFRSDKSGTDTAALSAEVINTFKSTLVTLKGVSVDFAKNIDVGSGALVNYSKEFKLVLGSDAAANQKTITDFFTSMGDDMATKLVPNIANFAFVSERASETLQRLSLVFSATNNLAGVLGKTVEQTFGSIGLASYDARQRLIELAGSLTNLNTQVTFYATNFLTEADKIAPVQAAVTAALAAMGLQAMTTTEQFSNVVKGLDLTTKAGAEQFSVLMALAPAFKQVADYIKESLIKMIKDATDKLDILKKDASDSFTVMSTLLTAQKAAGLALKDNANSAFEIVKGILELQKSSALELQSSLQATVASISKTPDSVMSRAAAQNQISNALDAAKSTGVLPTAASLSDALRVVSTPNSSLFATYVDFARDAGITAGKVSELSNLTAKSISNIEKQLSLAQIQVDLLNGVKVNTTDLITAMEEFSRATVVAQEGLIKANEIGKQLEFAQSQLDSLNDIKTKLSSMPSDQAIALDKQISFAQAQLDSLNGNKSSIILASLSQVNAIDKQIAVSQGQLEALNNSRNSILSTSSSQIASIERQINVSQGQLDTLKETKALSMNMPADQVAAIDKQISFAQAQLDSLNINKSLLMFSTANQIAGVDSQISFAQAQLDSLNSSKSLTLSLASSQVAAIDKQISFAQAQLNALNDIKTLTFGVQSAIRDFNTSLQAALVQKEVLAAVVAQATTTAVVAQAAIATVVEKVSPSMPVTYVPPVVATPPVVKYVPPVYVGTGTRSDFETDAYGNVLANYEDRFKSPGFDINGNALDGSHAIGLDNVPFDGYNAKLHKGEMVLPASSAQAVRSDASIAEIVLAVKESMQANSAENQSMASNLQILRKLFQQAMPGGNSLQTTTYVP